MAAIEATNAEPKGFRGLAEDGSAPSPRHPMTMSGESGDDLRIVSRIENLQTGTGTVQRTAISTVASTAVIFSLVDRSMASSERDANLSAALYAASHA